MRLYKLIEGLADINIPDREISSVTDNTKKVRKDCIFVCVKGGSFDGHDAAAEMLEKGAQLLLLKGIWDWETNRSLPIIQGNFTENCVPHGLIIRKKN